MVRNEMNVNKNVRWSRFKVPVKVKQINDNLFSDIIPSQKKLKKGVNDVRMNDSEMTVR